MMPDILDEQGDGAGGGDGNPAIQTAMEYNEILIDCIENNDLNGLEGFGRHLNDLSFNNPELIVEVLTYKNGDGESVINRLVQTPNMQGFLARALFYTSQEDRLNLFKTVDREGDTAVDLAAGLDINYLKIIAQNIAAEDMPELLESVILKAVKDNKPDALRVMLEYTDRADIDSVLGSENSKGKIAVVEAMFNKPEFLDVILEFVPQDELKDLFLIQDAEGRSAIVSAIFKAIETDNVEPVRKILQAVPKDEILELLSTQDGLGNTAMTVAAKDENNHVVDALLGALQPEQAIAVLVMKNEDGDNALDIAAQDDRFDNFKSMLNAIKSTLNVLPADKREEFKEVAEAAARKSNLCNDLCLGEVGEIMRVGAVVVSHQPPISPRGIGSAARFLGEDMGAAAAVDETPARASSGAVVARSLDMEGGAAAASAGNEYARHYDRFAGAPRAAARRGDSGSWAEAAGKRPAEYQGGREESKRSR